MKNWKHYFSELIMLFAAVSAGFWVDNYRDEQSEREVLKRKLEAFVNEYDVVMQTLDSSDFHGDFFLPMEFDAYDVLLKEKGDLEEKIRSLVLFYYTVMLPTDGFDDLIKFSAIMDRDEARFITDSELISYLLRLNDELVILQNNERRKADIDVRLVQLFAKHNMVADMTHYAKMYPAFSFNFFPPKDTTKYQANVVYGFGSNKEGYKPFGDLDALLADKQLKELIQEKYVLYLDDQGERDLLIQDLHSMIPLMKKEI